MPELAPNSPRRVLILGTFSESQTQALEAAGFLLVGFKNVYELAVGVGREGTGVRAVCIVPAALGPLVGRLVLLLKKLRPDLELWLAPGAAGQRADLAVNVGFVRWETLATAPNSPHPGPPQAIAQPAAGPHFASPNLRPASPGPPPRGVGTTPAPSERIGPIRGAAEPDAEPPIVVRMPPKPSRADLAAQIEADNAKAEQPGASAIEAEMAARYDALTSDPLLTDEELRALLDDSEGPSPEEPPRRTPGGK